MKNFLAFLALLLSSVSFTQNYTLTGTVTDAQTGDALPVAGVKVIETDKGYATDFDGNFRIALPAGTYNLDFSYVGYTTKRMEVSLDKDQEITVQLSENIKELDEVVIFVEKRDKNVEQVEMSTTKLEMAEIKKMPAFLGEVDVVRSIQLLPGVSTVGEGSAGFNVRGGAIDQNLILMDNANIFSSSHLFGFFSVFNSDALEDVKLYKGSIPSQYGGRISSVLDVHAKSGDMNEFHGAGGLGLVSSRLTLEGPIVKDKLSFVVGGRRSYADLFLRLSPNEDINSTGAYFYDLNGKLTYKINDKNKLTLSGYFGLDKLQFQDLFSFDWGNSLGSLELVHTFNDSTFLRTNVAYSKYDYSISFNPILDWNSIIENLDWNADFKKKFGPHEVHVGFNEKYYAFQPAIVEPHENNEEDGPFYFSPFQVDRENALESAIYISEEFKASDKLSFMGGLRYSHFANFGPGSRYVYQEGVPKDETTIVDTTSYGNGEAIALYGGLEPRFGMRYKLNDASSVKIGFNRLRQYIHLISNSTSGLPIDVWRAADNNIKPLIGDQIAAGYFRNFMGDSLEFSAEVYYKWMTDIVDYKNGAELLLNENLETELLNGRGRAYGLELMLKKSIGNLTGWLSYTLSRTERQVSGSEYKEEVINEGRWYRANYDKPHDVTLVLAYDINKRLTVSSNFTYATGRPITYPESKYMYLGKTRVFYPSRNGDRLSDYHRLDLSFTLRNKEKPNRNWKSEWVLSIYNVYARRNAFALVFTNDDDSQSDAVVAQRISILGTVLPSVTYNFSF